MLSLAIKLIKKLYWNLKENIKGVSASFFWFFGNFVLYNCLYFDLIVLNISNVITMNGMFKMIGRNATIWSIGDISNWNVLNVTYMSYMFWDVGVFVGYKLDLSGCNVFNVTSYDWFNYDLTDKITVTNLGMSCPIT